MEQPNLPVHFDLQIEDGDKDKRKDRQVMLGSSATAAVR